MKKIYIVRWITAFVWTMYFLGLTSFANTQTALPVGYWQTIDDVTGKPKAIIKIQLLKNHTLVGQVVKVFPQPGKSPNELCHACKGEKHDQPIIGMQILENLKQNKEKLSLWVNGKILDPSNGKIYHCNVQLIAGNKKLLVRGYLGLPLFGRTQTWIKVERL